MLGVVAAVLIASLAAVEPLGHLNLPSPFTFINSVLPTKHLFAPRAHLCETVLPSLNDDVMIGA
jgi:hypothetical protein